MISMITSLATTRALVIIGFASGSYTSLIKRNLSTHRR